MTGDGSLDAFTREWEAREEALSLEYYRQYAGLGASETRMRELAEEVQSLCRGAVERWARGDVPDLVFYASVANVEALQLTRLQNEIYRLRNDAVTTEWQGERVNLNNVRRFNYEHAWDAEARKRVFERLLEAAAVLTPRLRERFDLSRKTYGAHDVTPIDVYLLEEQVSLPRLKEVVDSAGRRARPEFERLAREFAREVLGKDEMEPFDDMYVYRSTVYTPVDPAFADVNYEAAFRETAEGLGFDVDRIHVDGEPREGKYSSPVCFGVRIPGDVRVLYQRTSPLGDYESFYHEMGHAVHFATVDPDRPYWDRRLIPNGIAEIFSTLFEELAMTPVYLTEDVGLAPEVVEEVARRRRFMELFFLTFYGANSMHKIRFWTEGLVDDFEKADRAYEELTERYMGVRVPGRYWQTHHILGMSDVYAPSYLLANIRKSELVRFMEKSFGDRWWRSPEAGRFLREDACGSGGAIDLKAFSTLDASAYLNQVLEG